MKRFYFLTFLFSIIFEISFGQNIEGRLIDNFTDKPIYGAEVSLKNKRIAVVSDANGQFIMKDIKPAYYVLEIKVVQKMIKSIEITHLSTGTNLGDISLTYKHTHFINHIPIFDISDLIYVENEKNNFSRVLSIGTFDFKCVKVRPRRYFNENVELVLKSILINVYDSGRVLWKVWNALHDLMKNENI